ncbi:MAG: AmmeMemoRadiSam system radical SAM enzyme [Candidatus Omnitrophica bacterium]|nr:AmmeMemoRadiSam system radical SAM enzyme [Candidatus Omnitrophota bacterium]
MPRVASYWQKVKDSVIQCVLCPRRCVINSGQRGVCTVRVNKDGILYTLGYGNPVAVHVDPIEKKPFFHVLPGTNAFSIAVAGCNMRCLFCQNWTISQAKPDEVTAYDMPPEAVVAAATKHSCPFIVYTYTEPTVFYEYMLDISKLARSKGLKNGMHTCGYINPEPLKELLMYMDAVNVDLKGFNEEFYRKMGAFAELKPVLETLKAVKAQGVWLEITNLIIPGLNDDPEEIKSMCEWIKENLGDEVPLHFSRFMPAFRLQNLPPTPLEKLDMAYEIARGVGLKYVYVGNVPGNPKENTYCPNCGKMIVGRIGYEVVENNIAGSKCKFCGYKIAGIWTR